MLVSGCFAIFWCDPFLVSHACIALSLGASSDWLLRSVRDRRRRSSVVWRRKPCGWLRRRDRPKRSGSGRPSRRRTGASGKRPSAYRLSRGLWVGSCVCVGLDVALTPEVISRRCLVVAVVLWLMCCHTWTSWCRHRTWHPTLLQYIRHWTGLSLCYPLMWSVTLEHTTTRLMSWVRPDLEILPWPSIHTSKHSILWCCNGSSQSEAR